MTTKVLGGVFYVPTQASSTVLKAFRVLDLFRTHRNLGVSQCAALLGMTRANAHRLLVSLTAAGAIERTDGGQYRLSIWTFEIGAQAPLLRLLQDQAQGPMERLAAETGQQAHLALRDGAELIYLLKISQVGGRVHTRPGDRNPLYATGLGKALLADAPPSVVNEVLNGRLVAFTKHTKTSPALLLEELATVRRSGFAYDYEERQVGVACIAMPLKDHQGQTIAAISIPTDAESYGKRLHLLQPALRRTTVDLERRLQRLPTSVFSVSRTKLTTFRAPG